MAITKETEVAEVRMTGNGAFSIRKDTVIKEDGTEISRSAHRTTYEPFLVGRKPDGTFEYTDTDISGESAAVQAIINAAWTDSVKTAFKAAVEAG